LSVGWVVLGWCGQAALLYGQALVPPPPPSGPGTVAAPADADNSGVEVLTRGPIHEAFAMPVNSERTTGIIIPRQPPDPVEEVPPEARPEGDNVTWISGYWSWDDDRKDFVWVSGVWRVPPPNFRWIPGYWQQATGGWQWISGFWMPAAAQEVEYLPEQPPQTLDQGPTGPAPGDNYFWTPGCWRWRTRYVWSPGFWAVCQPQWIWAPAAYYWTPRGWIYCDGHWDYPLANRGLLYSPVYFARRVASFRPSICVDVGALTFSLFCRPSYCHYYFGDYYASSYAGIGIYPWFSFTGGHYGYDPLFSYYRWSYHRTDPQWEAHLHGWFDYYRSHPDMRPPHTWAAQQRLLADPRARTRPDFAQLSIGRPMHELQHDPHGFVRLNAVSAGQRAEIQQSVREHRDFKNERLNLETRAPVRVGTGVRAPERLNFSKAPGFHALENRGQVEHRAEVEHRGQVEHRAEVEHRGQVEHRAETEHRGTAPGFHAPPANPSHGGAPKPAPREQHERREP
jgi:hypothetical protein